MAILTRRIAAASAFACGLAAIVAGRSAGAQTEESEASRLLASHAAERYDTAIPGEKIHAGGAMIAIDAPVATVRRIITDYAHYKDVLPGFQKSRVLAQNASGTDVYLQVPILHGAATLWAVTRFGSPLRDGNGERIEGRKTGPANIDDLRATWRIYPADEEHTVLKLELLLVPRLPLPASLITSQLAESADDAVRACRDRAEALALANRPPQASRPQN